MAMTIFLCEHCGWTGNWQRVATSRVCPSCGKQLHQYMQSDDGKLIRFEPVVDIMGPVDVVIDVKLREAAEHLLRTLKERLPNAVKDDRYVREAIEALEAEL